jgi:hypothetical protein
VFSASSAITLLSSGVGVAESRAGEMSGPRATGCDARGAPVAWKGDPAGLLDDADGVLLSSRLPLRSSGKRDSV